MTGYPKTSGVRFAENRRRGWLVESERKKEITGTAGKNSSLAGFDDKPVRNIVFLYTGRATFRYFLRDYRAALFQ